MAATAILKNEKSIQSGFSLIELITVIIILGILSAIALPRFFRTADFEARFVVDDLRQAMQFAQKTAVSSGCSSQLTLTNNDYQIQTDTNCGAGAALYTTALTHPSEGGSYNLSFPASVSVASPVSPVTLQFFTNGTIARSGVLITTPLQIQINQSSITQTFFIHGMTGLIE